MSGVVLFHISVNSAIKYSWRVALRLCAQSTPCPKNIYCTYKNFYPGVPFVGITRKTGPTSVFRMLCGRAWIEMRFKSVFCFFMFFNAQNWNTAHMQDLNSYAKADPEYIIIFWDGSVFCIWQEESLHDTENHISALCTLWHKNRLQYFPTMPRKHPRVFSSQGVLLAHGTGLCSLQAKDEINVPIALSAFRDKKCSLPSLLPGAVLNKAARLQRQSGGSSVSVGWNAYTAGMATACVTYCPQYGGRGAQYA